MKDLRKFLPFFILLSVWAITPSIAQHEGFIYGEVSLVDGRQYTGKIYWSAGQRMWVDMLTVEKRDNPLLKYLNNDELKKLSEEEKQKQVDWGFMELWENHYPSRKLTLRCRFGDIAAIKVTGSKQAVIIFKNSQKVAVYINNDREYLNQLGEEIMVYTGEKENVGIPWDKIRDVRFMKTPPKLPQFNAVPLYGTVLTRTGLSYTGLVRWDRDEHLTINYIDGMTRQGERTRYRFRDITSIRPKEEGALITLHSGEVAYLEGRSNVSGENQGILVRHPTWGQVTIRWKDFKEVTFASYPDDGRFGYDAFGKTIPLTGRIRTRDNKTWEGRFTYDLDERFNIETIDGWDNAGALRQVPFSYITKIYPINQTHTAIILKNGNKLVLSARSDVTGDNWGIMVWLPAGKFKYIPWDKVDQILMDQ